MDQDQVAILRLVRLPTLFKDRSDRSVLSLIQEYDLAEQYRLGTIAPAAIAEHLERDLSLIDLWIEWSADQRCSDAAMEMLSIGVTTTTM